MPAKKRNVTRPYHLGQAQTPHALVSTNQPVFTFDIEAINRDFAFLCLERKRGENWFGAPLLDKSLQTHQAKSALFAYGNFAFLMFSQSVDLYQVKLELQQQDNLSEVKVRIIRAILEPVNPCEMAGQAIFGHWLAQLLMNSLGQASRLSEQGFNNLTGKFYWLPNTTQKNMTALKVEFNFRRRLQLSATNFSEQSTGYFDNKKPNYLREGRTLKRVFESEIRNTKKCVYIAKEQNYRGVIKKARLPFLSIKSLDDFYQSKVGIWAQLHQRIQRRLGQYMTFEFEQLDITHRHKLDKTPTLTQRANQLQCKKICLVDSINDEGSQQVLREISELLQQKVPALTLTVQAQTQVDALNLRLLHDQTFYQEHKIEDPYALSNPQHAIQHITIENWQQQSADKTRQAVLNVCLKEAQLKQDFLKRQLTIFDWSSFCIRHDIDQAWWFISPKYQKSEGHKWVYKTKDNLYLEVIKVDTNGQLSVETITADCFFDASKSDQACLLEQAYACLEADNKKLGEFEGMVYEPQTESLNAFFKSDLFSFPDYLSIENTLKKVGEPLPKDWQTPKEWSEQIESFIEINLVQSDFSVYQSIFEALKKVFIEWDETNDLGKSKVNKVLGDVLKRNSHAYRLWDKYLLQNKIILRISKNEKQLLTLMPSQLELNVYQKSDKLGYSLGIPKQNLQDKLHNANTIRWIKPINGEVLNHMKLTNLLSVDFIQAKQAGSVLPFLFRV